MGSMYGNCTESGVVEGNVLLSFEEGDILLVIGRMCLSLTITFAFPVLVVPARDTFLRGVDDFCRWREEYYGTDDGDGINMEYRLREEEGLNDNDAHFDDNIIDF